MLYNAQQHAREWLAGENCRRTLDYFVDNYGTDEEVTELVDLPPSCGSPASLEP